jgi:hypothetical protein
VSNRRRLKPAGRHMSVSQDLATVTCGCGATCSYEPQRRDRPSHDHGTGEWLALPRSLGEALRAMSDEEAAEWAGVDVEVIRRVRGRG